MNAADQQRAAEVVGHLLPLVRGYWTDQGADRVDDFRDAGEFGMVLESVLIAADKRGIDLPAAWVRAAGESLAVPGMCPPGTDLDRLQRIVAGRVAA